VWFLSCMDLTGELSTQRKLLLKQTDLQPRYSFTLSITRAFYIGTVIVLFLRVYPFVLRILFSKEHLVSDFGIFGAYLTIQCKFSRLVVCSKHFFKCNLDGCFSSKTYFFRIEKDNFFKKIGRCVYKIYLILESLIG